MDAIATYNYVELPEQPAIAITPGPPVLFKAVLPTLRRRGGPFSLRMKGEDRWGNPSDLCERTFGLSANLKVGGLPGSVTFEKGRFAETAGNLVVEEEGDLVVQLTDERGAVVARSSPCRIVASAGLLPYWGDLHGQSEETIGTNSARDFFEFARDRAFLDICVHQGNDFQITNEFWALLNGSPKSSTKTIDSSCSPDGSGPGTRASGATGTSSTWRRAVPSAGPRTRWWMT